MPFQTVCPDCGRAYSLSEQGRGKKVVCKACRSAFVARPAAPASQPPSIRPVRVVRPADGTITVDRAHQGSDVPWAAVVAGVAGVGLFLLTGLAAALYLLWPE